MTPMNVVGLAGIPGIGVIAITHGLGALPATPPVPPANPLLTLGGGDENEEWWIKERTRREQAEGLDHYDEQHGYFNLPYGQEPEENANVAWELGEDSYKQGQEVSLAAFTSRIFSHIQEDERDRAFRQIVDELYKQDQTEAKERRTIVKVSLTTAGVTLVAWRLLPLL
jgi:hypothetical protein